MPSDARRTLKIPRDGSGIYSKPSGTTAEAGETITSAQFNSTVDDLVTDANAARPLTAGGTGGTSAATARTSLGVLLGQTSVTDPTAGSGLMVGGFGIGGAGVSAGGNLNNALYTGVYAVESSTENTPDTLGPDGSSCIVTRDDATNVQQIFLRRGSTTADVKLYIRHQRAGSWGSWAVLYGANNLLGTVSQTSGTPTGAAMEFGTGANGAYSRWANGWQECISGQLTFTRTDNTTAQATWTFPAAFIGSPWPVTVTLDGLPVSGGNYTNITSRSVSGLFYNTANTATTSLTLFLLNNSIDGNWGSGDAVAAVRCTAKGLWFAP